eukprot:Pgem_evm1s1732
MHTPTHTNSPLNLPPFFQIDFNQNVNQYTIEFSDQEDCQSQHSTKILELGSKCEPLSDSSFYYILDTNKNDDLVFKLYNDFETCFYTLTDDSTHLISATECYKTDAFTEQTEQTQTQQQQQQQPPPPPQQQATHFFIGDNDDDIEKFNYDKNEPNAQYFSIGTESKVCLAVKNNHKYDCGNVGMSESTCEQRGCCWDEIAFRKQDDKNVPWNAVT